MQFEAQLVGYCDHGDRVERNPGCVQLWKVVLHYTAKIVTCVVFLFCCR